DGPERVPRALGLVVQAPHELVRRLLEVVEAAPTALQRQQALDHSPRPRAGSRRRRSGRLARRRRAQLGHGLLERLDLVLEVVVGARARRVERAELAEEIEPRAVQLELVLRGRRFAREGGSLRGLGPDASPEPLDGLLFLANGRLELLLLFGALVGCARGGHAVAGEQRGFG